MRVENLNRVKVEKMLDDVIEHKKYVLDVCHVFGKFLIKSGFCDIGLELIKRAIVHDNSKLDEDEFIRLVMILNSDECFKNADYELSDVEISAIKHHWEHNSHHPEYHKSYLDMTELDIMEMVCDWFARSLQYGTNFLLFVTERQKDRFKFPEDMFIRILNLCIVVQEVYKNNGYDA